MSEDVDIQLTNVSHKWLSLCRTFATWKFFLPHPRDLWITTRRFGNNFVTYTLRLTYWERAWGIIEGVSTPELRRLKVWSELNLRQSENFFRVTFVLYITIPITAAIVMGQLFPTQWESLSVEFDAFLMILSFLTAGLLIIFAGYWKAREIDGFLFIALGERAVKSSHGAGDELGLDPIPQV